MLHLLFGLVLPVATTTATGVGVIRMAGKRMKDNVPLPVKDLEEDRTLLLNRKGVADLMLHLNNYTKKEMPSLQSLQELRAQSEKHKRKLLGMKK